MSNTRTITCALAVAGVLFIGSKAMAQQGGPSVTVVNPANNPAVTSSVDDPGRIPYQFNSLVSCSNTCFVTAPAVPQGKRLVVQHVGALGGLASGSLIQVRVDVLTGSSGQIVSTFTPPIFGTAPNLGFAFDRAILGYANAGSEVFVQIGSNGGSFANNTAQFIITGYLLDCTVNQCAPMAP